MGAGSYAARIQLAKDNGMVTNPNVAMMTLAGLIMGFWIFYGYYIPTFFAGEVKQAENTLMAGSWASLLVTWAIFVVAAILLQRLVPLEWIAAESYLSNAGVSSANPMPWITFYAAILKPNIILLWIVAIAWFYTLINLAQTYFFYCSRIIFAWSFDRLDPREGLLHSPDPAQPDRRHRDHYRDRVRRCSGCLRPVLAGQRDGRPAELRILRRLHPTGPGPGNHPVPVHQAGTVRERQRLCQAEIRQSAGDHHHWQHHHGLLALDDHRLVPLSGGRRPDRCRHAWHPGGIRHQRHRCVLRCPGIPPEERGHRYQLDLPVDPAHLKSLSCLASCLNGQGIASVPAGQPAETLAKAIIFYAWSNPIMFKNIFQSNKLTRILYGSDFHGSDTVFRKFICLRPPVQGECADRGWGCDR